MKPAHLVAVALAVTLAGCGSTETSHEPRWSSAHAGLASSWQATGAMADPRMYYTATALTSGKVLAVGGWSYNSVLATAEVFDPATGVWTPTGSMALPRQAHTATRLSSGHVLVVGGENGSGYTSQAQLYDPATGLWSSAGAISLARGYATATALPSGKVLVAGGLNWGGAQRTVDVYDPATGTWAAGAPMREHRRSHTATLLSNGKVLVAGGWAGDATAELYDPSTGTWSATGAMATARYDHTATLLPSGKVLVTGGQNGNGRIATAELYDPTTGLWAPAGTMATARVFHAATLASGEVLVTGGQDTAPLATVEAYDVATGTWSSTSSLLQARWLHASVLLESARKLLVVGGRGNATLASAEWVEVTPPASCKEILAQGRSTGDGLYAIDPDGAGGAEPFNVYCDMTRNGGGWTLAMVSSDDGLMTWTWSRRALMTTDQTLIGNVNQRNRDFKSRALHASPFRDLLFVHAPSGVWAAYGGVGNGSTSAASFMNSISAPVCNRALAGNGYEMTAGTLTAVATSGRRICDTDLYFHQGDFEGPVQSVWYCRAADSYQNSTYGPGWNLGDNNGCPFDDPSFASFGPDVLSAVEMRGEGFGYALGLSTGAAGTATNYIQMYVR